MKQEFVSATDPSVSLPLVADEFLSSDDLISGLPLAAYLCDRGGRITRYNQLAADLWGYSPDLVNEPIFFCGFTRVFHPDGAIIPPSETPMAKAIKSGERFKNAYAIAENKGGRRIHALVNINPLYNGLGQLTGAVNVFQDISELKTAELSMEETIIERTRELERKNDELKRSEDRYHRMIEEVQDYAIILLDRDGNIQNWNKGAEKIKGYKESEIIGKNFRIFYSQEDRDVKFPDKFINDAYTSGRALHEGWRVRKDGTKFWGSVVLTALHDDTNAVIGFSKVTRDLTDRKRAEDELLKYAHELEFQNEELEQFTHIISHDLQEPLRKITMFSQMVKDADYENLSDYSKTRFDKVIEASKRLTEYLKSLLHFTSLSKEEQFSEVDLNSVMQNVLNDLELLISQKHAILHIDKLPVITAIPLQMHQLFYNLLNNALKFSKEDRTPEVWINFRNVSGAENEHLLPSHNYYEITIRDNGVGFKQEHAEKIFGLFQRLHSLDEYKGSGIGLSLCKRVIANHQGHIFAESIPGTGSSFHIVLPGN